MNEELKQQMLKDLEQFRTKNTPQKSSIQSDLEEFRKTKTTPQTPEQVHIEGLKQRREQSNTEFNKRQDELKQGGGIGKTMAFFRDLGRGIENQATRQGGNILTAGASFIKGAGVDESRIPTWLRSGSEANEFATGKALEGQNLTQKVGAFGFGAASALAPTPFGKLGLTGKTGTFAKALTEGAQGDVMLTGGISPLTLGLAGTSAGIEKIGSTISKSRVLSEVNELYNKGEIDKAQEILNGPKGMELRAKLGMDTPEGVEKVRQMELETANNLLRASVTGAEKQNKLVKMSDDAKFTALQYASPEFVKGSKKMNLQNSIANIEKTQQDVYSNIKELGNFLHSSNILKKGYSIDEGSDLGKIMEDNINGLGYDLAQKENVKTQLKNILSPYINRNKANKLKSTELSFEDLDTIRRQSNAEGNVYAQDAYDIIADAFRTKIDLDTKRLQEANVSGFLNEAGLAKLEALELFSRLNKEYGTLKDARKVIDAMSKVTQQTNSRFNEMIGGVAATGGTYNPIAYLVGSEATKRISDVIKRFGDQGIGIGSKLNPRGIPTMSENTRSFVEKVTKSSKKKSETDRLFEELKK